MQNKWVIVGCGGHARSIADREKILELEQEYLKELKEVKNA